MKSKKSLFTNRSCNQQESLPFSPSFRNYDKKRVRGESSYFFINRNFVHDKPEGRCNTADHYQLCLPCSRPRIRVELTSIRSKGGFPLGGRTQSKLFKDFLSFQNYLSFFTLHFIYLQGRKTTSAILSFGTVLEATTIIQSTFKKGKALRLGADWRHQQQQRKPESECVFWEWFR